MQISDGILYNFCSNQYSLIVFFMYKLFSLKILHNFYGNLYNGQFVNLINRKLLIVKLFIKTKKYMFDDFLKGQFVYSKNH